MKPCDLDFNFLIMFSFSAPSFYKQWLIHPHPGLKWVEKRTKNSEFLSDFIKTDAVTPVGNITVVANAVQSLKKRRRIIKNSSFFLQQPESPVSFTVHFPCQELHYPEYSSLSLLLANWWSNWTYLQFFTFSSSFWVLGNPPLNSPFSFPNA